MSNSVSSTKVPDDWQEKRKEFFVESEIDWEDVETYYDAAWQQLFDKVKLENQCVWSSDSAVSIGKLGQEDQFRTKAELLRIKGTRAAADKLNSVEGMIACPEGFCIVYSDTSQRYHVLTRTDKPADILEKAPVRKLKLKLNDGWIELRNSFFGSSSHDRLKDVERMFDDEWKSLLPNASTAKLWSQGRSMYLCSDGKEELFKGKAELLRRDKFTSITSAAETLNSRDGHLACPEGYCIIFSTKANAYFVLFRKGKKTVVEELFAIPYQGEESDNEDKEVEAQAGSNKATADIGNKTWSKLRAVFFVTAALDAVREKEVDSYYELSSSEGVEAISKDETNLWDTQSCTSFCKRGGETKFKGKAELLKEDEYTSVREAVKGLNTPEGRVACPEGFCVVFSKSQDAYYLLWRSDKKDFVYKHFALVDGYIP